MDLPGLLSGVPSLALLAHCSHIFWQVVGIASSFASLADFICLWTHFLYRQSIKEVLNQETNSFVNELQVVLVIVKATLPPIAHPQQTFMVYSIFVFEQHSRFVFSPNRE